MVINVMIYELSVSKKEVARVGDRLVLCDKKNILFNDNDVKILNEWRMCHHYPLESIKKYLERESLIVCPNALISSRIKRFPSIVGKLVRYPQMKLNKMQDLGGCRAIVSNIEEIYEIEERISQLTFKHIKTRSDDYIKNTKPSGYRSLHIVHSFQNQK